MHESGSFIGIYVSNMIVSKYRTWNAMHPFSTTSPRCFSTIGHKWYGGVAEVGGTYHCVEG